MTKTEQHSNSGFVKQDLYNPDKPNILCRVCSKEEGSNKFLPNSIDFYRSTIFPRLIDYEFSDDDPKYAAFSNIAYNLQYLHYLDECTKQLYLTSSLYGQNVKTFVLISALIIESILYIQHKETGASYDDIHDFKSLLYKSAQEQTFGLSFAFYRNDLKQLKNLRNKIHIQSPSEINEADFVVFCSADVLKNTKDLLYTFLEAAFILRNDEMNRVFPFLVTKEK
ncbi:MAG: hypothetical protein WCP14_01910 [bacterium]